MIAIIMMGEMAAGWMCFLHAHCALRGDGRAWKNLSGFRKMLVNGVENLKRIYCVYIQLTPALTFFKGPSEIFC